MARACGDGSGWVRTARVDSILNCKDQTRRMHSTNLSLIGTCVKSVQRLHHRQAIVRRPRAFRRVRRRAEGQCGTTTAQYLKLRKWASPRTARTAIYRMWKGGQAGSRCARSALRQVGQVCARTASSRSSRTTARTTTRSRCPSLGPDLSIYQETLVEAPLEVEN